MPVTKYRKGVNSNSK